ncbi:MAG: Holliday junction branch migration protein RuvA [Erysipelotrichaceae bacterium]|nr:Holliday junction branch migration protein RuvA [Erysipelotrichaceae bacterium]
MICFLRGKVFAVEGSSLQIDVNGVGYEVLVSHPDDFLKGDDVFVYTCQIDREDEQYLVGFTQKEEQNVFLSLIKVKGFGPKTAINALSATTPGSVISAIASNNVAYLKTLPGVGAKAAAQIILDLKGELTGTKGDPGVYDDAYDALKSLGFKGAAIDRVLAQINEPNATSEDVVRIALTLLRK